MDYNYLQERNNLLYVIDEEASLEVIPKKLLNDLFLVRKILLLAINKKSYDIYSKNPNHLIMILSLLSFQQDNLNIEDLRLEIIKRASIIKRYFQVDNPSISKNTVYFKPNFKKIEMLLASYKY